MAINTRSSLYPRSLRRRLTVLLSALSLVSAAAYADAQLQGAVGDAAYSGDSQIVYGTRNYLKVTSGGQRYMSEPYGETEAIGEVVAIVKRFGTVTRTSARGLRVPDAARRETLTRYDLTYPASCGAPVFSYYEGADFNAIGYHYHGKMILDALNKAGPFSAPRLWGPYDQVVNAQVSMRLLIGNGEDDGQGFLRAGYQVGLIPDLTPAQQTQYGKAYSAGIQLAAHCRASMAQASLLP